jgi:ribonuclease Z
LLGELNHNIIKIIFLGTSAGVPTKDRNVTSILLIRKGEHIYFDFGEGTQRQVFKIGLGFRKKIKIFVTHMHGDHVLGIPALLQTLSLFKREDPLYIYGPPPLREFINISIDMLNVEPSFEIKFHPVYNGVEFKFREYYIKALKNAHGGPSFSYMFKEYDRPGVFNVELAEKLGIPKILWGRLSRGKDITYNGKKYKHQDFFIPPPIRGRKVVFSGDTMPFKEMIEFAKDADVLIHEATYTSQYKDRSLLTMHATAREVAEIAKKSNVKILILTHFSARYGDTTEILNEAREIFPATFIANDLQYIDIPYIKPAKKL